MPNIRCLVNSCSYTYIICKIYCHISFLSKKIPYWTLNVVWFCVPFIVGNWIRYNLFHTYSYTCSAWFHSNTTHSMPNDKCTRIIFAICIHPAYYLYKQQTWLIVVGRIYIHTIQVPRFQGNGSHTLTVCPRTWYIEVRPNPKCDVHFNRIFAGRSPSGTHPDAHRLSFALATREAVVCIRIIMIMMMATTSVSIKITHTHTGCANYISRCRL